MQIGDNIKSLRIKASMTQKQLAEALFLTSQAISRYEHNVSMPSIATLNDMAKIFNVSVDTIIGNRLEDNKEKVIPAVEPDYTKKRLILIILLSLFATINLTLSIIFTILLHQSIWTLTEKTVSLITMFMFIATLISFVPLAVVTLLSFIPKPIFKKKLFIPLVAIFYTISIGIPSFTYVTDKIAFQYEVCTYSVSKWERASNNVRSYMIDDFLARYELSNMLMSDVIMYLGKPDMEATRQTETYPPMMSDYVYFYDLGYVRDYINQTYFEINFSTSNTPYRVTSYSFLNS